MTSSYTEAELLELVQSERWQDQIIAATRTNVSPEVLNALMVPGLDHEVTLALISFPVSLRSNSHGWRRTRTAHTL